MRLSYGAPCFLFACVLTAGTPVVAIPDFHAGVPSQPTIAGPSQDRLTLACQSLYNLNLTSPGLNLGLRTADAVDRAQKKSAAEYLDRMAPATLALALRYRLRGLEPSSNEYHSIAYVLALHGIDVTRNMARLLKAMRTNDGNRGNIPYLLLNTYRKYPSGRRLLLILRIRSDRVGAEGLTAEIGELFLRAPRPTLAAAAVDPVALRNLSENLSFETFSEDMPERAGKLHHTLQAMERTGDRAVERAATILPEASA